MSHFCKVDTNLEIRQKIWTEPDLYKYIFNDVTLLLIKTLS